MKSIVIIVALLLVPAQALARDYHVEAIMDINPKLTVEEATIHVEAARAASAKYGYEVEFLLAQAATESAFVRGALSYMKCVPGEKCVRSHLRWNRAYKPKFARRSWYCGAVQVGGHVPWKKCRELIVNVGLNYMTGAAHLQEWETKYIKKDRKCRNYKPGTRDARTCALFGYVGGFKGLKAKRNKYPANIYRKEKAILRYIAKARIEDERWQQNMTTNTKRTWKPSSGLGRSLGIAFGPSPGLSWSEPIRCLP